SLGPWRWSFRPRACPPRPIGTLPRPPRTAPTWWPEFPQSGAVAAHALPPLPPARLARASCRATRATSARLGKGDSAPKALWHLPAEHPEPASALRWRASDL